MRVKSFLLFLFLAFVAVMLFACSKGGQMPEKEIMASINKKLREIPDSTWEKLSKKKIYFGHQSVGFNILDGVKDLMKEYPQIKLNIVETKDPKELREGDFAHSRVGTNVDPISKIDEFGDLINNGFGDQVDFAFMKLCYVDINAKSDVVEIFQQYKNKMEALKIGFPQTHFIYFTVPLTHQKTSWKTSIKKLIGKKEIWEYADNIKRNEFNQMLVKENKSNVLIFDIAKVESTLPGGQRSSFDLAGETYFQLAPGYTNDGGHLNEIARKLVASELLISLANAVE